MQMTMVAVLDFRPVYREPLGRVIIIFLVFETSCFWIEMLVSEVALLGLSIVVSVVAMTAPTSALTVAPTIISAPYLRLHRRRFQ